MDTLKFTGKDKSISGLQKQILLKTLMKKLEIQKELKKIKNEFSGKIPDILVGAHNYPTPKIGFLSGQHEPEEKFSDPISNFVLKRSVMINSYDFSDVKNIGRLKEELSMTSKALNPVEASIHIDKKTDNSMRLSTTLLPHGPSARLKKLSVDSNPKIPRFVDYVTEDTDMKANMAVIELNKKGYDETYITKIFSAANLGEKKERKLVPTKWSITAVDDMISKNNISNIMDEKEHDYGIKYGSYLGNHFIIIFFPSVWSFELFETYVGAGLTDPSRYSFTHDFEGVNGRKKYAEETAGGYYATRLPVSEYLSENKKKGSVIALRFIDSTYWAPLGVWVVRRAVKETLNSKINVFNSLEEALRFSRNLAKEKFNINIDKIINKSFVLKEGRNQRTLSHFINK